MAHPTSVLTISRNELLQHTRTLILENAGYSVVPVQNDEDALAAINSPTMFSLVLMCHSVPEKSRVLLASRIKELRPNLPLLMLYNGYDPTKAKVDGALHNLDSPDALLDMIGFMTRGIAPPSDF